jgi:hypothetical protein
LINRPTSGETVPAIIGYLKRQNISCFRGTYFIQWRIIFESREQLIGSSRGLWPTADRYPPYDELVRNARRIALIFHKDDAQLESFLSSGMQREFDSCEQIGEYVIFTGNQPESFKNLKYDHSQLF